MWICTKILPKSIMMKIHKCKSLNWCDTLVLVWYQKTGLDRDLAEMFLPTLTPTQRKKKPNAAIKNKTNFPMDRSLGKDISGFVQI